MLTFFRKIRKSLNESSSARKYLLYAIGEIALVVIGILIALQVNNWNEKRQEIRVYEEEHKETVLAIFNDLQQDIETIENVIDRLDDQYQSGFRVHNREKSEHIDISNSVLIAEDVNNMLMNVNVNRRENMLDNLKASGDVDILKNQGLVRRLFTFYADYDQRIAQFNEIPKQARREFRELSARGNTFELIVSMYEADNWADAEGRDIQSTMNWLEHPEFDELVRLIMTTSVVNISFFKELIDQTQLIKSYMEETYPNLLDIE
jgi:hypothetical protein